MPVEQLFTAGDGAIEHWISFLELLTINWHRSNVPQGKATTVIVSASEVVNPQARLSRVIVLGILADLACTSVST